MLVRPAPVRYTASKPWSAMTLALIALNAPGITRPRRSSTFLRNSRESSSRLTLRSMTLSPGTNTSPLMSRRALRLTTAFDTSHCPFRSADLARRPPARRKDGRAARRRPAAACRQQSVQQRARHRARHGERDRAGPGERVVQLAHREYPGGDVDMLGRDGLAVGGAIARGCRHEGELRRGRARRVASASLAASPIITAPRARTRSSRSSNAASPLTRPAIRCRVSRARRHRGRCRVAGVDQRRLDRADARYIESIDRMSRRDRSAPPARRPARINEFELTSAAGKGDAVEFEAGLPPRRGRWRQARAR